MHRRPAPSSKGRITMSGHARCVVAGRRWRAATAAATAQAAARTAMAPAPTAPPTSRSSGSSRKPSGKLWRRWRKVGVLSGVGCALESSRRASPHHLPASPRLFPHAHAHLTSHAPTRPPLSCSILNACIMPGSLAGAGDGEFGGMTRKQRAAAQESRPEAAEQVRRPAACTRKDQCQVQTAVAPGAGATAPCVPAPPPCWCHGMSLPLLVPCPCPAGARARANIIRAGCCCCWCLQLAAEVFSAADRNESFLKDFLLNQRWKEEGDQVGLEDSGGGGRGAAVQGCSHECSPCRSPRPARTQLAAAPSFRTYSSQLAPGSFRTLPTCPHAS